MEKNDHKWGQDLFQRLQDMCMEVYEEPLAQLLIRCLLGVAQKLNSEKSRQENFDMIRSNLGYLAGYRNHETRLRVERLFNCVHPIFGPALNGAPTAKEAFELGKKWATEKNLKPFKQPKQKAPPE